MRNQAGATGTGSIVQTEDLISVLFFLVLPGFFPLSEIMCVQEAARAYASAIWRGRVREEDGDRE